MSMLFYAEGDNVDDLPCHAETGVMAARRTARVVLAEKCILLVLRIKWSTGAGLIVETVGSSRSVYIMI